eukprot:CAMPEP_0116107556 /NCGR_PEP_ID=MMETSP0327-20121206/16293_1 /TAXON_ID=44447 /ORGANISM="Pseudo-nitzschia delicatissima, Strain B596" /LENGTH=732 /DNA_ID=CAMNT_0003600365 /DNA_START=57 /DNA_END=2255 /DNA_ORIENTATION=+
MLPLMARSRRNASGRIRVLARNQGTWRETCGSLPLFKRYSSSSVGRHFGKSQGWKYSQNYHRSFSAGSSSADCGNARIEIDSEVDQIGAWTIISSLEKAKEAELFDIARLAASMDTMLDTTVLPNNKIVEQQKTSKLTSITNSSTFVSLPDVVERAKHSAESLNGNPSEGIQGDDIRTLLHTTRRGKLIDLPTILALLEGVTVWNRKFRPDSKLVTLPPLGEKQTLTVIGDLHGSLSDLATVLEIMPGAEPNSDNLLLFNGDLADRGDNGIEIISIVCALCLAYPQFVYINRGNHEDLALSIAYGLMEELRSKYGQPNVPECLPRALDDFFRSLPLATIVEEDALIVHGGPPPPNRDEKLAELLATNQHPVLGGKGFSRTIVDSVGMVAPHIREEQEIIEALLWSDPLVDETGRLLEERHDYYYDDEEGQPLGWHPNPSRGAGYVFDVGVVRRCLEKEGLNRMVRSHEQIQKGCFKYKIPTEEAIFHKRGHRPSTGNTSLDIKPHMELFTVFSASKYPYKEGFNQGAVLELKANGQHKILRYTTEDDDPIVDRLSAVTNQPNGVGMKNDPAECSVITLSVVRENLFEALHRHEEAILQSLQLQNSTSGLSFDSILDILIKDLNLRGESNGLKTQSAKNVLAKALGIESTDDHIDLEAFSDFINRISREQKPNSTNRPSQQQQQQQQQLQQQQQHRNRHLDSSKAKSVDACIIDTKEIWELLDTNKDSHPTFS